MIVCEPEDGEICASAKGAMRLRIELTGAMAHGAMPQHGRNPMPVAARGGRRAGRASSSRLAAEHARTSTSAGLPHPDRAARR